MPLIPPTGTLKTHLRFWLILPVLTLLAIFIAPAFQEKEKVTVLLDDCVKASCELKGDLSVDLFTRDYVLTRPDGTTLRFEKDRVSFMHWESEDE